MPGHLCRGWQDGAGFALEQHGHAGPEPAETSVGPPAWDPAPAWAAGGALLPPGCGAGQLQALLTFFFSLTLVLTFPRGSFIPALEVDVCRGAGRDKWCRRGPLGD